MQLVCNIIQIIKMDENVLQKIYIFNMFCYKYLVHLNFLFQHLSDVTELICAWFINITDNYIFM